MQWSTHFYLLSAEGSSLQIRHVEKMQSTHMVGYYGLLQKNKVKKGSSAYSGAAAPAILSRLPELVRVRGSGCYFVTSLAVATF